MSLVRRFGDAVFGENPEEKLLQETVRTEDAVGMLLAHDITRIVHGVSKGRLFKKGHKIQPEDVESLKNVGKNNIFILTLEDGEVHEDEAGVRLGDAIRGENTYTEDVKESRVNVFADCDGLLKVNEDAVFRLNDQPYVVCSTKQNNIAVKKGDMLAGTKVVPLVVGESDVAAAEKIASEAGWVVKVLPYRKMKVGVVVTGSEVYYKRIEDAFAPVITEKMESFGSEIMEVIYVPDDPDMIRDSIVALKDKGADIIFATGGMSVDPDDYTPSAIRATGAEVIKYGAPALPGAMFMMAYLGDVPVLGVPGAGMFYNRTVVDLLLPRILAGEKIERKDIVGLGVGGLL